ncbi:D-3-phosphoglycerate dehydrogenase 1, chloroplastic [Capsicum baccatum]|uniref:D-3-phosphoglycerate dehydrogenase 1, chloroplastic n=1 Tax=Capsicum baccatum TaxID=33114 RepID=A0A2G2WJ88_CAPBA|nr:D-3-phosphoglycerate dehydrogenase 1, chloroplastic [Capsicum baccatum]
MQILMKLARQKSPSSVGRPANTPFRFKSWIIALVISNLKSGTKVTQNIFEFSGQWLKVVGRASVDIDNTDRVEATKHGFLVVNVPTTNTVAVFEHGIAILIVMSRNVSQFDASIKAEK